MAWTLSELLTLNPPAWADVQAWIRNARNPVEVLPAADPQRAEALLAMQVTVGSPMGAIIYETGGLLVDHGWLRVLGSGHPRLPRSIAEWNRGRAANFCLIADDVLGGFFALNGGALAPEEAGIVFYFAPDTLRWESLGMKYTAFLDWCFSGDLASFYEDYRWSGWQTAVRELDGDKGFSILPFPFAKGPPRAQRTRAAVPIAELYGLYVVEFAPKLRDLPDGTEFEVDVAE